MSYSKKISDFIIEKVLPIKFKVWLLDRLACDIANQGEEGDTELAHINSYEAKLLRSVGGSGTINKTTGLKQYKGGGGGAPAPASTQTVVEKAEFPPEIREYIKDILTKGQAQEVARIAAGYPVFPGPRIATFTPEERAAQAGIIAQVGATQPSFDIARGLTAAGTGAATTEAIQQGMSPYMQNVVDIQKREAERANEARRQQLAAQGVAARAFGGTREALMQAELERNLQQQLADIQATGSQAAFQQAQEAFERQKQRQLAGGQQMAGLGTAQQAAAMKELGALAGVGEQQRQQQQKALDLAFQQFREEQVYPEASLQQYSSLIRGFPLTPTTTQTQQSLLPTPSLGQQLIGAATTAAGLGMAGTIPRLFEEGKKIGKPIPEDNKGLQALAKESPETVQKMGFVTANMGSLLEDLMRQQQTNKNKNRKKISPKEKDNMLKIAIEAKGLSKKDSNKMIEDIANKLASIGGLGSLMENEKEPIEMFSGQQPIDYMNPQQMINKANLSVPSLLDYFKTPKEEEEEEKTLDAISEEYSPILPTELGATAKRKKRRGKIKPLEEIAVLDKQKALEEILPTLSQSEKRTFARTGKLPEGINIEEIIEKQKSQPEQVSFTPPTPMARPADIPGQEVTVKPEDVNVEKKTIMGEGKKDDSPAKQSIEAQREAKSYLDDVMEKLEGESAEEFKKRRGFAIAKMGLALMGGKRFAEAGQELVGDLSEIEKGKLAQKNKMLDLKIKKGQEEESRRRFDEEMELKREEIEKVKAPYFRARSEYINKQLQALSNIGDFDKNQLVKLGAIGEGAVASDGKPITLGVNDFFKINTLAKSIASEKNIDEDAALIEAQEKYIKAAESSGNLIKDESVFLGFGTESYKIGK